jgi:hypothetical protein
MLNLTSLKRVSIALLLLLLFAGAVSAQRIAMSSVKDSEFGPVMRAYLGYLKNEQEVVDDRASRREITTAYYRRNSNRIHALRQMAMRLVQQSGNDYVPELEAVTADELGTLFEKAPRPATFRQSEILDNKFRFLGLVHAGEPFYLFARLDPYEQAELMQKQGKEVMTSTSSGGAPNGQRVGQTSARPRRAVP